MTPIVVAMEVDADGVPVREAFVCISTPETVEGRVKQLESAIKNGSWKDWAGEERRKSAEGALARGNTLVFKPFFY